MTTSMPPPEPSANSPAGAALRAGDLAAAVGIVAAVALMVAPTLGFAFLHGWDDNLHITTNTARLTFSPANVAYWFTHDAVSCYLPLTMLSYMADYAVWGLNALGFRLQNLLWHSLAAVGFLVLLRRLGLRTLPAFLGALLWAIHPQRVESVVWISERKDVLCAAGYIAALLAYLQARQRGRRPVLAMACFLAAMLSKSMAISLPVAFLALEAHLWCRTHGRRWPARSDWMALLRRLAPFVVVAAAFIPVTIYFQSIPVDETPPGRQVVVAAHNLLWYAGKTLWPGRLCPIYPRLDLGPAGVAGLAGLWLALGGLLVAACRRWSAAVVGVVLPALLAYAAALAPVSGLVPLGHVDMSDRYALIPTMALWALAAAGLNALPSLDPRRPAAAAWQRLALPALACLAAGYLIAGVLYGRLWRDIETLTRSACQREPASVFALGQLGDILIDAERFDEVLVCGARLAAADHAWMTPAARQRALARGLYLQGFALFRLGQPDEALHAFEAIAPQLATTIFHEPTRNTVVYAMMAEIYLQRGQTDAAVACYDAILERLDPESFEAHFYAAVRALQTGRDNEARRHLQAAEQRRPGHPLVQQNLARLGPAPTAPAPTPAATPPPAPGATP